MEAIERGESCASVARRVGVHEETIARWRDNPRRGGWSLHPTAKRERARALRNTEGYSWKEISRELGVPSSTVAGWFQERRTREAA
jgi:transposase-like protein